MEEELTVVLNRRNDPSTGLGFSLLDKPGFPPVIYDIEENSPAAESGKVIFAAKNTLIRTDNIISFVLYTDTDVDVPVISLLVVFSII